MDEKDLTPWFPGDVKPAHPGVYQRHYPSGDTWYARWDGKKWHTFWGSVALAARDSCSVSGFQRLPWRGLAHPPKGA
jgi:hypothetical protein